MQIQRILGRGLRLLAAVSILLAFACDSTSTIQPTQPVQNPTPLPTSTFAGFDVTADPPIVPFPNSIPGIVSDPATGRNNVPNPGGSAAAFFDTLNELSGWSTLGSIVVPFQGPVTRDSAQTGIAMYDMEAATPEARTLAFQFSDDNTQVIITPVTPLRPGRRHVVVVTAGTISGSNAQPVLSTNLISLTKRTTPLVDGTGASLVTGVDDATAAALEPLRQAMQSSWADAEQATGLSRNDIPFAFNYQTQALFASLPTLVAQAAADNPSGLGMMPVASEQAVPGSVDQAFAAFEMQAGLPAGALTATNGSVDSVWGGAFSAPWYLPADGNDISNDFAAPPVAGANPFGPVQVLAFFPANPVNGCVIYQHGLTQTKETAFFLAEAACAAGFGLVAIDAVDHGSLLPAIDAVDNTSLLPVPDGQLDGSGDHFINIVNVGRTRDNVGQSVIHLAYLSHMLANGNSGLPCDANPQRPMFLGHSLGGIIGTVFVAVDSNTTRAVLNVPGGRWSGIALNSGVFGPLLLNALQSQGVQPGSAEFLQFFIGFQTILDDSDPANYAFGILQGALKNGLATEVLIQEVVGDDVIPNSATDDIAFASGISQVDPLNPLPVLPTVTSPFQGSGLFEFQNGPHAAILQQPNLQIQAFTYFLTGTIQNTGQTLP